MITSFFRIALLLLTCWAGGLTAQPKPPSLDNHIALIQNRGVLRVGVKADYPPWGMIDQDGALVGLEPDLAQDLADRLNVALVLVPVTASNRTAKLAQDDIDIIIATMADTAVRREQMTLISPTYYASGVTAFGRLDPDFDSWDGLRGMPVCLTQGAFYNRILEDRYGIVGQYYPTNRETKMALAFGKCRAWAFDDTLVSQLDMGAVATHLSALETRLFVTPWAIAISNAAQDDSLGNLISTAVIDWHRDGTLLRLEDKWGIAPSPFIRDMNRLWAHQPGGGDAPICAQDHAALSAACLGARPFVQDQSTATVPGWAEWLQQEWGLDISVFFIPYAQRKLLTGLLYTLGLSISSILGAVLFGISLSLFAAALRRRARWLHIVLWPQEVLIRVARMVPPILQMYILFFGLGSVLDSSGLPSPGPFVSALIILVLYAGATCAAVLSHSFETALQHRPNDGVLDLFPDVFRTSYDGLVAACVNTVKAAGLASVIALPELVSSVNLIILEGGSATILMNGLVLFYLVLVLAVLKGFALLRASIAPTTGVRTQ